MTRTLVPVFAALGDETRWSILAALGEGDASASALAGRLPVTRQAIAKHLAVLQEAGLVEPVRVGREVQYRVLGSRAERDRASARRHRRGVGPPARHHPGDRRGHLHCRRRGCCGAPPTPSPFGQLRGSTRAERHLTTSLADSGWRPPRAPSTQPTDNLVAVRRPVDSVSGSSVTNRVTVAQRSDRYKLASPVEVIILRI